GVGPALRASPDFAPMPTQLRQIFRESAMQRIPVIEEALQSLRAGVPGADDTLRRLARQLHAGGAAHGFPEITEPAGRVVEASAEDIARHTAALLDTLHGIVVAVPGQQRTVLVVDDDPIVTTLLTHGLTRPDRTVVVAATWAEAQAQL